MAIETKLAVYVGVRHTHKDKRMFCWREINDGDNDGTRIEIDVNGQLVARFSGRKNVAPGRPGSIWRFHVEEHSWFTTGDNAPEHVEQWNNREQVIEWQTEDDAGQAMIAQRNKVKAIVSKNLLAESLDPIRAVYKDASAVKRRQILALVLEYITRR